MTKRKLPLAKAYGLLETGPVTLITTAHKGRTDIMTQSWHTMMEFEPPLVGCVIGGDSYSFELLRASRECVINIPTVELAKAAVKIGNTCGRTVDKFAANKLTAVPASMVGAPLIDECYAGLECRVADAGWVNKYNFFVLEVVQAWVDPACKDPRTLHHRGNGAFMVAGETVRLRSRMK